MKKSRQIFQAHIPMLFSNVYHRSNFISDRRRVTYYDDSRRRSTTYDSRRRTYDSRRRSETTYDSRRRSETTYDSRRRTSYSEDGRRRSTYNTDSTRMRGNKSSHGKNIGLIFGFLTGIPVLVIVFYCCYKQNVYEPPERMTQSEIAGFINATGSGRQDRDDTGVAETPAGVPNPPPPTNAGVGQQSSGFYPPPTTVGVGQQSSGFYPPPTTAGVGQESTGFYPPPTTAGVGQESTGFYPPPTTAGVGQESTGFYPPPTTAGVGQESTGFYPPPAQPSDFDIALGGADPPPSYHTPETNFTAQMSHSTSGSSVQPDAPPGPYGAYYPPSHTQFPPTGQAAAALPQTSEPSTHAPAVGDAPPSYMELFPS